MEIRFVISYTYPTTTWDIEDASAVAAFNIVDINDSITLRFANSPDITRNFDIFGDPFDTLIVAYLEWETGEFEVGEGCSLFNKVITQRHIPDGAKLFQIWVLSDDLNELRSLKRSIAMVRNEHEHMVNVKYEDWDIGMKVLEKMYRVSCD